MFEGSGPTSKEVKKPQQDLRCLKLIIILSVLEWKERDKSKRYVNRSWYLGRRCGQSEKESELPRGLEPE